MKTKDKILKGAAEIYNSEGINATTRHIATHLSMSAGNLHYHFKHTDDIMISLYRKLEDEFNDLTVLIADQPIIDHQALELFIDSSFSIVYKYRFILLNFVEISRRIPLIQISYQQITERRKAEFRSIFERLVSSGYFRNDLDSYAWDSLVTQCFIISDFWLSHNELTWKLSGTSAAVAYTALLKKMMLAYRAGPI